MLVLRLVGDGETQSEAILTNLPDLRLVIKYSNQSNNKSRDKKAGMKHPIIAPRISQQLILIEEQKQSSTAQKVLELAMNSSPYPTPHPNIYSKGSQT